MIDPTYKQSLTATGDKALFILSPPKQLVKPPIDGIISSTMYILYFNNTAEIAVTKTSNQKPSSLLLWQAKRLQCCIFSQAQVFLLSCLLQPQHPSVPRPNHTSSYSPLYTIILCIATNILCLT